MRSTSKIVSTFSAYNTEVIIQFDIPQKKICYHSEKPQKDNIECLTLLSIVYFKPGLS